MVGQLGNGGWAAPGAASAQTHEPAWRCYPSWALDCLLDPRVIHNIPFGLRHWRARERAIASVPTEAVAAAHPLLALSFDIEHDPVYGAESARSETARPFLEAFQAATAGTDIRATFFVQGEMVPDLMDALAALANDGHAVGLHGYSHELWGRNNWVKRRPPIIRALRLSRLEQSIRNFEAAGLPRPIAWRAPIFTMDLATYGMLSELGFTIDSSVPTQRGMTVAPHDLHGLHVVPVSCAPLPELRSHPRLRVPTVAYFYQFDYNTLINTEDEHFGALVEDTLRYQIALRQRPYLLVYGHNWEFQRGDAGSNLERLLQRIHRLTEMYGVRQGTVNDLANKLFVETAP